MKKLLQLEKLRNDKSKTIDYIQSMGYQNVDVLENPENGWFRDISFDNGNDRIILCFEENKQNPLGLTYRLDIPSEREDENQMQDYDITKVCELEKSLFIQLSNKNENIVRYFCIGNYNKENLFTGLVYGYEGGGEFSDQFVYKNKYLPMYGKDGEPIDWECNKDLFDFFSKDSFDDLDDEIRKILDFDTILLQWLVIDEQMSIFENSNLYRVNINCNPPSYGLTSWDNTIYDTWDIDELNIEIKTNSTKVLIEYIDDYITHHNAFPIDMLILLDTEYEVKISLSEFETILGDKFSILANKIDKNIYNISIYEMDEDCSTPFKQYDEETNICSEAEAIEYLRNKVYQNDDYAGMNISVDVQKIN